jgi:hypothetical protein
MRNSRWILIGFGGVLVAIIVMILCTRDGQRAHPVFTAGNGSVVSVETCLSPDQTYFHVYEGNLLQRGFNRFGHGKLPAWLGGWMYYVPISSNHFAVVMRHGIRNMANPSEVFSGSQEFVELDAHGREIIGLHTMTIFRSDSIQSMFGRNRVNGEQNIWEFPQSAETNLHFRFCLKDPRTGKVSTNEFVTINPDFKGE